MKLDSNMIVQVTLVVRDIQKLLKYCQTFRDEFPEIIYFG